MIEDSRNCGLDIYRIFCCMGVLTYHIMDDVLGSHGALVPYYMASYCVPGFFMLSGYLIGIKKDLSVEYCETKIISVIKKYFGWVIFWVAIHFIFTGEMIDLWGNVTAGVYAGGILPVAWFIFTYCLLQILVYPLWKIYKEIPYIFVISVIIWMVLLASGFGIEIMHTRPQSIWLHLYIGYFCLGMVLVKISTGIQNNNKRFFYLGIDVFIFSMMSAVYAYNVNASENFIPPSDYYGTWFYTIWLVSGFRICCLIDIKKEWVKNILKKGGGEYVCGLYGSSALFALFNRYKTHWNDNVGTHVYCIVFCGIADTS